MHYACNCKQYGRTACRIFHAYAAATSAGFCCRATTAAANLLRSGRQQWIGQAVRRHRRTQRWGIDL